MVRPLVRARAIALYLPQYHPIPENDAWWGTGFTEWTNVRKARPLFPGHDQPRVPADLGYYDLRSPETREAQAALARANGIEAFCYYHYWFAGRRLLERPLQEVVASGRPGFPFCVCWANQSWSGVWHGSPRRTLIEQRYPGEDDHRRHFEALLPAFSDPRYVRVGGRPLFMIFQPETLPDARRTLDLWRTLAVRAGLPPLYIVCEHHDPAFNPHALGFDASVIINVKPRNRWQRPNHVLLAGVGAKLGRRPRVYAYADAVRDAVTAPVAGIRSHPCVLPNWDNTPRNGANGIVYHDSNPERFRAHLRDAVERAGSEREDERIIYIKSWNEWAEGNYLEPDEKWGHAYLRVVRDELFEREPVVAG
jgi:lipopolysaccharide biosynthesis protein